MRAETPQVSYIFKHNITQEVVHRTLLEEQRSRSARRRAVRWKRYEPDQSERLAHHLANGDLNQPVVRQNALHYLGLAGDRFKREYANETVSLIMTGCRGWTCAGRGSQIQSGRFCTSWVAATKSCWMPLLNWPPLPLPPAGEAAPALERRT
ncbi:MAG: hypothetical protein R2911_43485 [Caldilineaceae bacterium]